MLVAENLDVRLRKLIAQELDRRQRENEIADRAAANDENAIHIALPHPLRAAIDGVRDRRSRNQYRVTAQARIAAP